MHVVLRFRSARYCMQASRNYCSGDSLRCKLSRSEVHPRTAHEKAPGGGDRYSCAFSLSSELYPA